MQFRTPKKCFSDHPEGFACSWNFLFFFSFLSILTNWWSDTPLKESESCRHLATDKHYMRSLFKKSSITLPHSLLQVSVFCIINRMIQDFIKEGARWGQCLWKYCTAKLWGPKIVGSFVHKVLLSKCNYVGYSPMPAEYVCVLFVGENCLPCQLSLGIFIDIMRQKQIKGCYYLDFWNTIKCKRLPSPPKKTRWLAVAVINNNICDKKSP